MSTYLTQIHQLERLHDFEQTTLSVFATPFKMPQIYIKHLKTELCFGAIIKDSQHILTA